MRIASAFTNPVITDCETKRIRRPSFRSPATTCTIPIRMVAAKRYCTPWSRTSPVIRTAVEAVAAEIMAGRPPLANAMTQAITTEA